MKKERFKIIPTVYSLLVQGDKILLARRYNTGFHDGEYSVPAGHLEGNETLTDTLIREIKEEIDVKLDPKGLQLVHVMHRKEPTEGRINFFFLSEKWVGEPKIMEPNKCDDLRWFRLDSLPKNVIPYVKQAINSYLKNEFYIEYDW